MNELIAKTLCYIYCFEVKWHRHKTLPCCKLIAYDVHLFVVSTIVLFVQIFDNWLIAWYFEWVVPYWYIYIYSLKINDLVEKNILFYIFEDKWICHENCSFLFIFVLFFICNWHGLFIYSIYYIEKKCQSIKPMLCSFGL